MAVEAEVEELKTPLIAEVVEEQTLLPNVPLLLMHVRAQMILHPGSWAATWWAHFTCSDSHIYNLMR